jgi:hypothetical protein
MNCRVPGCMATTEQSYGGRPLCMQAFAGDPEAHRQSLRGCMMFIDGYFTDRVLAGDRPASFPGSSE